MRRNNGVDYIGAALQEPLYGGNAREMEEAMFDQSC
jgi:hypothetical protein